MKRTLVALLLVAGCLIVMASAQAQAKRPTATGVRLVDLGVVTSASIRASGPLTLYVPAPGEYILGLRFSRDGFVGFNGGGVDLHISTADFTDLTFLGGVVSNVAIDTVGQGLIGNWIAPGGVQGNQAEILTNAPLVATLFDDLNTVTLAGASGTWQATHSYSVGQTITETTHVQTAVVAGMSGGGPPAWNHVAGVTTDGTVTWQDEGPIAVVDGAAVHVFALIGVAGP